MMIHVRKIMLIQPMVITIKGGGEKGDNFFFPNLNYMNIRDNHMQVYNKTI